jgi:unsaturated rhamnogalacturonyl hydrolase
MRDRNGVCRCFRITGYFALACLLCAFPTLVYGQQNSLTVRVADSAMKRWPNGHIGAKDATVSWGFEPGIVLAGFNAMWNETHDPRYLNYIQQAVNQFVTVDGAIRTYDSQVYSLNNILIGRQLLALYRATGDERYRKAADTLHEQLLHQPRTASGGYWHTRATPDLMLLDDTFMFAPFLAEYAATFKQPKDLDEIAVQFGLLAEHTRDAKTGLFYHGWDESRSRSWVDKTTGTSSTLWARGMGWYLMALVDTLPYLSPTDPQRAVLIGILQRTAASVVRAQDSDSGLWYQVLDKPGQLENYIESSSVLMFTYALAKGARLGYLPASDRASAMRAWRAVRKRFVEVTPQGNVKITGTVTHIGLGAGPQDDGSYSYYLHAPVVSDDPKGVGAFLLAATEIEFRGGRSSAVRTAASRSTH